jgi:thymidine kinase
MLYQNSSYLKVIIGPMFSSKSSHLIEEVNRYKHITKNIICINHISDKQRYDDNKEVIKTHNNNNYKSFMCQNLFDIKSHEEYIKAEVVIIDEAQFFLDLTLFVEKELKNLNKKIFIVAGLSGDINQKPIGEILNLIPMADEIKHLSAFCLHCSDGTLANFTRRKTNDKKIMLIGGNNLYEPVCRYHYHILNQNK